VKKNQRILPVRFIFQRRMKPMTLSDETRLEMYWMMLLARRLDERAWVLHRQGKIT
jgi:2-oxoisovalerate dehydrogenase E1 component alpha subunit